MNRGSSSSKVRAIYGAVVSAVTVALLVFSGCVSDDEDEDGDGGSTGWSRSNPIVLVGNSNNWTREFTANRQEAWFRFEANGRYDLTVRDNYYTPTGVSQSPYTVDVGVTVTDASGNYIKSAYSSELMNKHDMGGGSYDETLSFTDLEGTYYVKVEPWHAGRTGTFYIALERTGNVTAGESQYDAIELVRGAPRATHELTTSRPNRWFEFTAPISGSVDLTVFDNYYEPTNANVTKPNVDVGVTVTDASGEYISGMIKEDMGANNQSPRTIDGLTAGETYYIMIEPWHANRFGFFYIMLE